MKTIEPGQSELGSHLHRPEELMLDGKLTQHRIFMTVRLRLQFILAISKTVERRQA